jgi:hypothetical protein
LNQRRHRETILRKLSRVAVRTRTLNQRRHRETILRKLSRVAVRTRTLNQRRHREAAGRGDPCFRKSWIDSLRSQ